MQKQPSEQSAWEYKLVSMGNPLGGDIELRANALGKLGWELAAIDAGVWIFKRPADEEEASSALQVLLEETVPIVSEQESPEAISTS